MTDVSISTHVIAAGIAADGKVRLTLSIMPVKAGAGVKIDIAKWPEEIRKFLMKKDGRRGFAVVAVPIKSAADLSAPTDARPGVGLNYQFAEDANTGVQTLWREVATAALRGCSMPQPGIGEFWEGVANVFRENNPGDSYVETVGTKPVPVVLSTGRGDAAVLHLLDQTKRLTDRIKPPLPAAANADGAVGTVSDSWDKLKEDEIVDAYRSDKTNKDKLDEILKSAQESERDVIDKQAVAYFEQNKQYFLNPAGAVPPSTLTSAPIDSLFGDNESVLKQTQALHLAALLPDSDIGARPKGLLKPNKARDLEKDREAAVDEPVEYVARNFVAAIRSSPMLARLFGFVVDVEIKQDDLKLVYLEPGGKEAFVLLGAGEPAANGSVETNGIGFFSIAKAVKPAAAIDKSGFWPVTREEAELRLANLAGSMKDIRSTGKVSQVNGVVDLGQVMGAGPSYNPRFDIISIDPVFAMEASVRNAGKIGSNKDSLTRLNLDESTLQSPFQDEPERGVVSRGLAIVDRWRALSVSNEIIAAAANKADPQTVRIVDGDDLTIGYRVDVAVRIGENGTAEWRSLMEREIDYRRVERNAGKDDLKDWFKALSLDRAAKRKQFAELEYEADRRRDYDAGLTMPTSRRRLRADGEMIHAEEMISAWEGDPLGLNCGNETIPVRPGSDVAIHRTFYLPNEPDEEEHKAWPLRYGWAYRFGIRPVWLGGVSLPLKEAIRQYDNSQAGYENLSLPLASTRLIEVKGWRRFLRYEPILAPVALLPYAIAWGEKEPNFLPQSGIRGILRTLYVEDERWTDSEKEDHRKRYQDYQDREVDSTWRVILPPRISLDEAVRHGVFDALNEVGTTPPGDLLQVDYDAVTGKRSQGIVGSGEELGQKTAFPFVERTISGILGLNEKGVAPEPAKEDFFRVHAKAKTVNERGKAPEQYYADPMADRLVVALRPNNRRVGENYFKGVPRVFDIRAKDGSVLPVALKIKRDRNAPRSGDPTQEDFWEGKITAQNINGNAMEGTIAGGSVQARMATLQLRAGESVEIDCWFVPSPEKLRAYFGWPEALAVKAAADIGAPIDNDRAAYRKLMINKLKDVLNGDLKEAEVGKLLEDYKSDPAWVGLAGKMADPAAVAAANKILYAYLLKQPLPEISSVRTIDAVHAVALPPRLPLLQSDFALLRSPSKDEDRQKVLEGYTPGDAATAKYFGNEGDDGIVFVGSVQMDRDTCRQLEVLAHCTPPSRAVLDDVRLGRTELQRLLGEWPKRVVPLDADGEPAADRAVEAELGNTEFKRFKLTPSAQHLFGFDVDEEGNVYLPKQTVTLLHLENLAEQGTDSKFAGLESIDLVKEQLSTLQRQVAEQKKALEGKRAEKGRASLAKGAIRAAPLDHYADRRARKIVVTLQATSRFDAYFTRLTPSKNSPLPETIFPPIPEEIGLIQCRSHKDDLGRLDDASTYAEERAAPPEQMKVLWIPATIAPAKPQVHAVLPSYNIVRPTSDKGEPAPDGSDAKYWRFCRRPRIRILLDRPWYSSGEGERLGVVLWPPHLVEIGTKKSDAKRLESGKVLRSVLHAFDKDNAQVMELNDFRDEDLGLGGKFTTRWGADPIRENTGPIGPFLPREAILKVPSPIQSALEDARKDRLEDEGVRYVPSIAVPLRDLREEEDRKEKEKQERKTSEEISTAYETLTAALATFVPRFDVESEKWFVDLALNSDLAVEPFIRLGLVRYQERAGEGLCSSAPVAVWAQIPPERTVEVWLSTNAAGDTVMQVQVSGKVSGRARTDRGRDKKDETEELLYPRMRISVIEVTTRVSGVRIERIATARKIDVTKNAPVAPNAPEATFPAVAWAEWSPPDPSGSLSSPLPWYAAFTLPVSRDESGKVEVRKFAVVVEEIEEFPSTANDPSPQKGPASSVAADAGAAANVAAPSAASTALDLVEAERDELEAGKVRSGPRFLARIDVDYDEVENQPRRKGARRDAGTHKMPG
ncbi:hypothetical protein [Bradyrhizobium sp. CCGB20]|uniref:hypothetical protein n=1 Tax=Bradyrhizobium sp. CCGB20 TaxID=2949633 RepID=UPI0020B289A1|nr:hypothetical protein [Bradyrhizobium sp. CCGB20]MCP3399891.1 hypothetical protein [Bradyrhizobium sp. CCGB20]